MFCPKCAFENPDEAKFCGKCGEALPIKDIVKGGEVVSDKMKIGISILSVIIPLVGIIMGILYLKDPNPEKKSAGKLWLWIGIGAGVLACFCSLLLQTGNY